MAPVAPPSPGKISFDRQAIIHSGPYLICHEGTLYVRRSAPGGHGTRPLTGRIHLHLVRTARR